MAFLNLSACGNDPRHFKDVEEELDNGYAELSKVLRYQKEDELLNPAMFNKSSVKKEQLVKWLASIAGILISQKELVKGLRDDVSMLKTELIESQNTVIKIQGELLDCKNDQLSSVQATVQSTVQDTVQAGMKSYSQAITTTVQNTAITAKNLKKVVQDVVAQEDRTRNVMIFGLKEESGEKLNQKVSNVLEQIGAKPRVEAVRIGKQTTGKTRPVKVTVNCSSTVHQILVNSKDLRSVAEYKHVFICPDRSPDERVQHTQLVLELKKKVKEEPGKRHYIRNGQIFSENKV